ncbi:MAG TPA: hypothetical protein VFO84_03185, partial [Dehalococcoidia bacterium]|nr:hypothetical protein [Dehalococcoidia bacterium]
MAEQVLFLPGWGRSPAAVDVLAGYRELTKELRGSFDVDIFSWPSTQPTPIVPPTWQGAAEAVRSALTPGCHVVVVSGNVAIVLMALDGETAARTLVCDGL